MKLNRLVIAAALAALSANVAIAAPKAKKGKATHEVNCAKVHTQKTCENKTHASKCEWKDNACAPKGEAGAAAAPAEAAPAPAEAAPAPAEAAPAEEGGGETK
jgi:hypothetical protein